MKPSPQEERAFIAGYIAAMQKFLPTTDLAEQIESAVHATKTWHVMTLKGEPEKVAIGGRK